jgi:mRNA-degrading endonuclease toxin of MazEF toxin-antitoxin module
VNRGEIYRTAETTAERGGKPGFYVVVSRQFIAEDEDISTVVCAPIYGRILGVSTEVVVGVGEGLPRDCAIRADFLCLMFKARLSGFVSRLGAARTAQLDRALRIALDLHSAAP